MKLKSAMNHVYYRYKKKKMRHRIVKNHHDVLKVDNYTNKYEKYGFSKTESKLFNLDSNNYKEYITTWEAYQPRLKSNPYFCISDDKYLFSLVFQNFIKVPKTIGLVSNGVFVPIAKDVSINTNLYDYACARNGIVIKDRVGSDGFDVFVMTKTTNGLEYKGKAIDRKQFEEIISRFSNGIIQQNVLQSDYGKKLYPNSINTVRVITVKRKDGSNKHEVIAALQRIGTNRSAPVDNFNQGGGSALIDLESGMLGKMTSMFSVDSFGNRQFFGTHPDTGERIEGMVVPNWQLIKESLIHATEQLPFFDYIAWDVAVQDDGFTVIEINMKSSLNVFQIHRGMRNELLGKKYREHGYLCEKW